MKSLWKSLAIGLICLSAKADILKLRDGRMLTGVFLGATRSEIWFQSDAPGDVLGTAAFPVEQVESLTFGPVARQSKQAGSSDAAPREQQVKPGADGAKARRAP
jgi:hypothetical protein